MITTTWLFTIANSPAILSIFPEQIIASLTCIQNNEKNIITLIYKGKKDVRRSLVLEAPTVKILR